MNLFLFSICDVFCCQRDMKDEKCMQRYRFGTDWWDTASQDGYRDDIDDDRRQSCADTRWEFCWWDTSDYHRWYWARARVYPVIVW